MPFIYGTSASETLRGTAEDDSLYGRGGNDVLYGFAGNDILYGHKGADLLYGGAGNDRLFGATGKDTLEGGDGNDRLDGGTGADVMRGGNGSDVYFLDNSGDTIIEAAGAGFDTVCTSLSYTLGADLERLTTNDPSGTAPLALTGNDLSNTIIGNAGANIISGGARADRLYGGAGNDSLSGDGGRDVIHGGAGNDIISGTQWTGNDVLYGDAGADVFHFETYTSAQISGYVPTTSATLMDFQTGVDTIHLHLFGISTNDHTLYWLGAGEFTGANRIEATFEEGVLQIDYNGDQVADLILNVPRTVAATDFTFTFDPWGY